MYFDSIELLMMCNVEDPRLSPGGIRRVSTHNYSLVFQKNSSSVAAHEALCSPVVRKCKTYKNAGCCKQITHLWVQLIKIKLILKVNFW